MPSASKAAGDVWIGHVWLLANSDPAKFGCGRALQQDHSAVIFVYFSFLFLHWASNLVGSRKKGRSSGNHRSPRGENPALAQRETL